MLKTIVTLSKSLNIRQNKCPTNPKESETLLIRNSTLVSIVSKSQTLHQLKSSSTNVRVTQLRRRSLLIFWGTSLQPWSSPWGAPHLIISAGLSWLLHLITHGCILGRVLELDWILTTWQWHRGMLGCGLMWSCHHQLHRSKWHIEHGTSR